MPQFTFEITPPKPESVMVAQTGETLGSYELKNVCLEYEVIESPTLVGQFQAQYADPKDLRYDYTSLVRTVDWKKESTAENVIVNIPRQRVNAVVLFFKKKGNPTDSEEFCNANIETIKVTIEGTPNAVYSDGLKESQLYNEAAGFFRAREDVLDDNVSLKDFYDGNKYAVVIDLRAVDDENAFRSGRNLKGTQDGILLEIEKKATTTDLKCYIFVIADGVVRIQQNQLVTNAY